MQYTDSTKIQGVHFDIEWHIDVDSARIDAIYQSDAPADDLSGLLNAVVLATIYRFLSERMTAMKRETIAWKGQYNNV
jgi:hypothetical protein